LSPTRSDVLSPIVIAVLSRGSIEGQGRYALLPLDDELVDFLIARSPAFRDRCREIRKSMDAGQCQTHEEVRRQLVSE
jgi:hypothetical protein